ncbi:recombinase family protein [Paracoccus sp. TK19116]|uniref:Recombinase family protein n=1 Tax=Paracoccus albicereus TaxID=2922394 RepID=A0ABT1MRF2_9RHOB|nr:recombinase family protein [Paracoccus albicereus]MCQ0970101.1 recombinase family protein [Paracoccus albicereus]
MSASPIRCAIYTRKSSEEGLEQGFNTLDAQHEACAAYIASQRHEGWRPVRERYDDGGFSGGNTDRPALQRLLAEVDAGRIGMIVVYKIDRLTRSLADFAKLVERLEAKGCSFVSVTQAFNTSTSMGRLTLNVLLSFAQFEREVAGERIRDKIAASKKRGLWMGGTLPLGYDRHPDPREQVLVVNEEEAGRVQRIFDLYEELGCLSALTARVTELDLRSKSRRARDGREIGHRPLGRGQLHYLLTNPVYRGRTRHGDREHEGQHPAIIDADQWTRVQEKLIATSARKRGQAALPDNAALAGKLVDETGDRLTPTHTRKGQRRYRYYVSHRMIAGATDPTGWRLPAAALEQALAKGVADHLGILAEAHTLLVRPDLDQHAGLVETLRATGTASRAAALWLGLITKGQVGKTAIHLNLDRDALATLIGRSPDDLADAALVFSVAMSLTRRGIGQRLVIGERGAEPDHALIDHLGRAHRWLAALKAGADITSLAKADAVSEGCVRVHLQLAFLAPAIQRAILDGTQPEGLTLHRLTRPEMPSDWQAQYERTGIHP